MSTTVHVEGISPQTSEKEIRDFFSFCGKITSLSVTPTSDATDATKSASVTFEKETAAKTALLLDNTQLGSAQVHVKSAANLDQLAGDKAVSSGEEHDEHTIAQEDKPRSRIFAEYLAHGYVISDKAIERALALDQQHGISTRFTQALQNFDSKFKATERAQAIDTRFGVSERAATGWQGLNSYFEKALATPTGQKLRTFYETGNKQVMDVHREAVYLSGLKSGHKEEGAAAGSSGIAPEGSAEEKEKMGMEQIGGDKTKCQCGSNAGKCPCPPGKCACANCAKNPEQGI